MNNLTLITQGKTTSVALQSQLTRLLGDKVNIVSYYLNGNIKSDIADDLVLISSQLVYKDASRFIRPGCPTLIARRSINYHEIDKLLNIPAKTKVLLVNESTSTAVETISLLKALGIDHLEYFPFAPEIKDYPKLEIAITPGELELIPDFVNTTINIKTRNIDFTTLVEILKFFSLLDEEANLLSATYIKDIIDLIKKTKQMANLNNRVTNQLQTLINMVPEGIIALDEKNYISVFNSISEELLEVSRTDVIGKNANSKNIERIIPILNRRNIGEESFIKVNDRQIVVKAAQIKEDETPVGKVFILKDITEIQRLERESRKKFTSQQNHARYIFADIQGASEAINTAKNLAQRIAVSDSPVLIQGESGTGKELFAQSIHNASTRKVGPFIAVNFAALTESLLESELFGYSEGSFTGAKRGGSPGLFEQAHTGTVFLDEIGDAPVSFQVKLLRVLQEKQVRRIGSSQVIPIDVRVITATNKDLKELISKGQFRQDLYYRLKVLSFKLPPLRHRKLDISSLTENLYLKYFKNRPPLPAEKYFEIIMPYFLAYDWPGNIRELQNVIEYLASICPNEIPGARQLPEEFEYIENDDMSNVENRDSLLIPKLTAAIAEANKNRQPIGRRSLAKKLALTEGKVRRLINEMVKGGYLKAHRGVRGLTLT